MKNQLQNPDTYDQETTRIQNLLAADDHRKITPITTIICSVLISTFAARPCVAQQDQAELAKATLNPVASLISVPIKIDYDQNIGPIEEGNKTTVTIQPVLPFSISEDWNVISRTLIPLITQHDIVPGVNSEDGVADIEGSGSEQGISDITQQFYFSPKAPTAGGWIWGVGPQFLLPTGSPRMTASKWGVGPTFVVLKQEHGFTYGALANQTWSVSGNTKPDVSVTYVQPFLSYTTKKFTSYTINTESTYNWKTIQWSVPVNLSVTQLLKLGGQPLTIQGGARYWADTPDGIGPKGWGLRVQITLLFPKK
jgi:hypothetical protein